MDICIACSNLPFLWKGQHYQIVNAGIKSGQPYATVSPNCPELVSVLFSKLAQDRELIVYLGNGFCCFLEDRQ